MVNGSVFLQCLGVIHWPVFLLGFLLAITVRWWKKDRFPCKLGEFFFEVFIALAVAVIVDGLSHLLPWRINIMPNAVDTDVLRMFSLVIVLLTFLVALIFNITRNIYEDIRQKAESIKELQKKQQDKDEHNSFQNFRFRFFQKRLYDLHNGRVQKTAWQSGEIKLLDRLLRCR